MSRRRPRAPGPERRALRRAARLFLAAIGEPGLRRDLRLTPERVADAWHDDIVAGYRADPERLLKPSIASPERGMVVVRDIPFVSVCAHHLLPFHGRADVGYLPDGRLAGLSKIARVVDAWARRLQLQERLTGQVVDSLERALAPRGVACRVEAEHLCMTIRGARKRGSSVVTTAWSGEFARRPRLRLEFLRLCAVAGQRAPGRPRTP